MNPSSSRTARVFLLSTFRDFGEERDLLVRRVFPSLRARLKDRFVELVDVDLPWGIKAEHRTVLLAKGSSSYPKYWRHETRFWASATWGA